MCAEIIKNFIQAKKNYKKYPLRQNWTNCVILQVSSPSSLIGDLKK